MTESRSKTLEVMARAITRFAYRDAYEAAEQALTAYESHLQAEGMAVAPGWQPIESAPKDGTRILVWLERGYITVGYWLTENHKAKPRPFWGHELYSSPSHARRYPPTHWMPLPAASPYGKAVVKEKDDE